MIFFNFRKYYKKAKKEKRLPKTYVNSDLKLSRSLFGKVSIFDFNQIVKNEQKSSICLRDIKLLQDINQKILSKLNFTVASQLIVDKIRKDLGYPIGTLFIVEKEKGIEYPYCISSDLVKKLEIIFGKSTEKHVGKLEIENNFTVKCANTKKAYFGNDLRDFVSPILSERKAFLIQKIFNIKSVLIVPLVVRNVAVGSVLIVSSRRLIDTREAIILKSFSDQMAIALHNAKLYEKSQLQVVHLQEKTEDLESLLDISTIAASSLKIKSITQKVVNSIPKKLGHLGYAGGVLTMYNPKTNQVYTHSITESEIVKKARKLLDKPFGKYSENIDKADNLVIKTIKTKEMQIGSKFEDFVAPTVNKRICGLIQKVVGAKSFISIPMLSGGRVKGTIVFVGTKPKSKIVQRDKDILLGFSSHIGATIENAQLYEQTEKQIKALSILNENLKMANIRLKELMEMKNEFLHITSHQLRTPLTTIRGMIAMWHNGDFDNLSEKEKKKMLKRIYISSERLNNITNDMLDSLELEGGFMKFQFKKMSLREITKETVDIMRPNFDKKNLYLKFNDNADIPKIEVEPNYIRQVFVNTIDNACKYTRKGGAEIDIKKSGKYVEVIIKDTGIGVGKSDQKKIFQKFTRGKKASIENASGSGLGLFIAKKIVDAHNGKVKFSSEGSMRGSVVKILLPVKQG
ncbi:GAF domain-containing sensor histidine kinase [Candidatus Parcubacteria bacterium]|nr:GAF domain-containing sensor histidine kinase [Candidatus Parcubacteria bacterium]